MDGVVAAEAGDRVIAQGPGQDIVVCGSHNLGHVTSFRFASCPAMQSSKASLTMD
jgi:hypothetical protein